MKIALAQTAPKQTSFDENLNAALDIAKEAASKCAKLVVFPEMFTGGFHYPENKAALATGRNFAEEVAQIAKQAEIFVAGTVPALSENSDLPVNRLVIATPDGKIETHYDKIHLFGAFNENKYVASGESIHVKETSLGRLGLAICYDLRFPEMFVNMALKDANLIILSAAWPHPRMNHFRTLVRARAIETQSFVVAVNQAGVEDFGVRKIQYGGESCAIDPFGETICECKADAPDLQFCKVSFKKNVKAKERLCALADRKPHLYK